MLQVWLVGATNVGKSTLFNRLIGQFRAIVTDIPGTTTDIVRHHAHLPEIGQVEFLDSPWLMDFHEERPFIQYIIDHSDVILFVIDDSIGFGSKEQEIFSHIMRTGRKKDVMLIVNKLDIKRKEKDYPAAIADYYSHGFADVIGASALKEIAIESIKDLLQSMIVKDEKLRDKCQKTEKEASPISFAIVGKPNAGKSTLLNTFVGEYISKVEDKAGTTRDYISKDFIYEWQQYTIFDTAGIKRTGHMRGIEKIAYTKTKEMLKFLRPVVVFMIDATEWVTHRDMTLIKEVYNIALPFIVCLNKMDLLNKKQKDHILKQTQAKLDFAQYIPIVPLVATSGDGIPNVMKMIKSIYKEATKRIDTWELNRAITKDMITRPPRFPKNKICKIMYVTQVDINAPTFVVFVNYIARANFAFKRWIDNTIRKYYGFIWVPIVIRFKARERREYEEFKVMMDRKKATSMRDEKTGKKLSRRQQITNNQQKKDNALRAARAKHKNEEREQEERALSRKRKMKQKYGRK